MTSDRNASRAHTSSSRLRPATLEEAGLSLDLLIQLALKTLHFAGELTGAELARRLGLNFSVIEPALELLKTAAPGGDRRRHDGGPRVVPLPHHRRRPAAGRALPRIEPLCRRCAGAVRPVPALHAEFRARPRRDRATRDRVRDAFSHLVISQHVLDQLGPAINAGHSMFVYGPPGNGKTVISQAIRKLLARANRDSARDRSRGRDHPLLRSGQPRAARRRPKSRRIRASTSAPGVDRRWVRCKRPMVMVGGELTLDALELSYNPTTGFYRAPVQAIANGGVLVIDDFGRQQCAPRDLLNRWIVPLESRVDFLTLQSGQKFELPFMVLVIFATNIKPAELVDEAFLRRIHYKVFAESPTVAEFIQIFENCCRERKIAVRPRRSSSTCSRAYYEPRKIALRGCQPRDLIDQVLSLADYLGEPRAAHP